VGGEEAKREGGDDRVWWGVIGKVGWKGNNRGKGKGKKGLGGRRGGGSGGMERVREDEERLG